MKLITFITHYENVAPKYKGAVIKGIRWGMYIGGAIVMLIFYLFKLIIK